MAGDEKQDSMSQPITRGELHEALETWAGAVIAEVKREVAEVKREVAEVKREVAEVKREVAETKVDLARHAGAMMEHTASLVRVVDDKYKDLPGRMDRVERAVYKRTKRATSRSRAPRRR